MFGKCRLQLAARNGGVEVTGHAVLPPVDVVSLDDNEIAANMYGNVTSALPSTSAWIQSY